MVSANEVGWSVLYVLTVAIILTIIWPYLPTTGAFSQLRWELKAVAVVVLGFLVIGPGRVAYDLIVDDGY